MAVRQRTRNKDARRAAADGLASGLSALKLLGRVITLGSHTKGVGPHKHADVVHSLTASGLDAKLARTFAPRHAWTRACKKLEGDGFIDILEEDTDRAVFQLTAKVAVTAGEDGEIEFRKDVNIILDKASGQIRCKKSAVREAAQAELDRCMEERTTSDVTQIAMKVFQSSTDLIPLPGSTAVYFVPESHAPLLGQVTDFLTRLGRKPFVLPVPAGVGDSDAQVQTAVEEYLDTLVKDLRQDVEDFSVSTRDSTVEEGRDRIMAGRIKVEAYAEYLKDRAAGLLADLNKVEKRLRERVDEIVGERQALPADALPASKRIDACMGENPRTLEELVEATGLPEARVKTHLVFHLKKGRFVKDGDGYKFAPHRNGDA